LLAAKPEPKTTEEWTRTANAARFGLATKVLCFPGGKPGVIDPTVIPTGHGGGRRVEFEPEPGIHLTAVVEPRHANSPLAIVLNLDGGAAASTSGITAEARKAGWTVAGLELRATGTRAVPGDKIGRAPDHNSAEWGLWIGRPLLGQWTFDVRRLLDAIEKVDGKLPADVAVIGEGPAGLVALCAAATDERITKVAAVGTLASYISEEPYVGQRLGVMAPGILRDVGDVADLAALAAPRRVVIAGGVTGGGTPLTTDQLRAAYRPAARVYELLKAGHNLTVTAGDDRAGVLRALK
jgi:hypothetical protein